MQTKAVIIIRNGDNPACRQISVGLSHNYGEFFFGREVVGVKAEGFDQEIRPACCLTGGDAPVPFLRCQAQ